MTTDSERLPAAWEAALERFRGGYGCEFDPSNAADVRCLVQLLEEEVHNRITRELVTSFRAATARIEQATARLLSERPS